MFAVAAWSQYVDIIRMSSVNFSRIRSLYMFIKSHILIVATICTVMAAVISVIVIKKPNGNAALITTSARQQTASSPRLGRIELGAFAPEAALEYGITSPCLMTFDDGDTYRKYRSAVLATYGVNLSDMNYLGIGVQGWQARYVWLHEWLFRASQYGDPTIALEPIGPSGYGVFKDTQEMQGLRQVFEDARQAGITVWVRFASESNNQHNPYSVLGKPRKIAQYRKAVRWFRAYMPSNIRLVFSPLINTAFLRTPEEMATLRAMYVPGDYDRIGGTIYATSWLRPDMGYTWYYNYMRKLDPNTRFQICELGGSFCRKDDICRFVQMLRAGTWPLVDRVNLFAGELNPIAINHHGHFGLVLPGSTSSYLRPLFANGDTSSSTDESRLPNDAALGNRGSATHFGDSDWRSDDMLLKGSTVAADPSDCSIDVLVTDVTDCLGQHVALSPARTKHVFLQSRTTLISANGTISLTHLSSLVGAATEVSGWDQGTGSPLHASAVVVSRN